MANYGLDRQREIFIDGISGKKPLIPIDFAKLEKRAGEKMSKEGYAYLAGGAGREQTIQDNSRGFNLWQIWPRMLRGVAQREMRTTLFGDQLSAPFLLAPIGVLELAHQQADLAVAKAAAKHNIPFIFSNQASVPMERCSSAMGDSPRWFQLYWSKSRDLVQSFVQRAEGCGASAIVVTLDTTMLGWRPRDLDLAYLPFLQGKGIAQYVSDPVFQRLLLELDEELQPGPQPAKNWSSIRHIIKVIRAYPEGSLRSKLQSGKPLAAVKKFINMYTNPAITWTDLAFLRENTQLPILLKGILHPDDALKSIDFGMDGIIVSNHGGRQVDGAVSTAAVLPQIVKATQKQIKVLVDSGIRSGSDIFKALALGADAVCIGRPYAYALALAGEAGVDELIRNYKAELDLCMALTGCRDLTEIDGRMLRQA
jgi:lactate 2-monooxygenase